MSDIAITIDRVSRMFKRYRAPRYRIMEALGLPLPRNAYDEFWALRDISLAVRRGERIGLIGRNGAGKSTLLNIICGRLRPTSGSVVARGDIQALMELGTGFHPEFTGRENIIASLSYQGLTGRAARQRVDEIIDFSELEDFIDQPVKVYSAGMYARLAFSTATAMEPNILIIDEVLGAGDAYFAGKCTDRMRRLTEESGATVLFVSHDISSVQLLCQRAIWLERGQVHMTGNTLEVSKAYYASVLKQEEARLRGQTSAALSRLRKKREESAEAPLAPESAPSPSVEITAPPAPEPRKIQSEAAAKVQEAPAEAVSPTGAFLQEKWDTDEANFVTITPFGSEKREPQFLFRLGEPIHFSVVFDLRVELPLIWLVIVVYDMRGNRILLVAEEIRHSLTPGRFEVALSLPEPNLRQDEYVATFELYPEFNINWNGEGRLPYLCHWDRCVFFRIDERHQGAIHLGVVAIASKATVRRLQPSEQSYRSSQTDGHGQHAEIASP
jgi:ABC-type polysaccharide/polyol phosphate transport system ATPase subunit